MSEIDWKDIPSDLRIGRYFCNGAAYRPQGVQKLVDHIAELQKERDEYKEIAIEFAKDIMHHVGIYIDDDSKFGGYYDSVAMTMVKLAGDFLVGEANWERHPDGFGRRWFYRPKVGGEEQ